MPTADTPRIAPGGRPTSMLAAFFAAALTMLVVAGLATAVYAASGDDRWRWLWKVITPMGLEIARTADVGATLHRVQAAAQVDIELHPACKQRALTRRFAPVIPTARFATRSPTSRTRSEHWPATLAATTA